MKIIKANKEKTTYDQQKIVKSLKRAGADQKIIQHVLFETERELFDGISTKAVYKIVFRNLKKLSHHIAGKYHLKKAIMELGPTGFPFEKFIAAIFEVEEYKVVTNQIIEGMCIKHEIDVIAEKDNKYLMIECKFHGNIGNVCDIKDALYVHARFIDIENMLINKHSNDQKLYQGWLVTNTRLTSDAEQYGKCVKMILLSWNYPQGDSLREKIDRNRLYPITCLTTLSKGEKKILLDKNIVICKTICERPFELNEIGLSETRKLKVLEESEMILKKL